MYTTLYIYRYTARGDIILMRLMILEINATLMQSSKSITLITAVIVNKAYSCDVMHRKQMNSYCRNTKLYVETFEIVMYALYIHALSIYGTYCVSMFSMYIYDGREGFPSLYFIVHLRKLHSFLSILSRIHWIQMIAGENRNVIVTVPKSRRRDP